VQASRLEATLSGVVVRTRLQCSDGPKALMTFPYPVGIFMGTQQEPARQNRSCWTLTSMVNGICYCECRSRLTSHRAHAEIEIVRKVAHGHPNKIIADVLSISSWTVCARLWRIFTKLGVASRAAMVARFLECGELSERTRNDHTN
jgi:DNA-binding CsgD family transcriptional regulator